MFEQEFGYRRQCKRLRCSLNGNYVSQEGFCHGIRCNNISAKGAGLVLPTILPINSHVKIELNSKRKLPLFVDGKVCWCNKIKDSWSAGIEFTRVLPFAPKAII